MPELTALLLAEQYRSQLLSRERAAAVRLTNAYGAIYSRLKVQIDSLTAELDTLQKRGELSVWKVGKLSRLKALKGQILDEMQRYSAVVGNEMDLSARAAVAAAQQNGYHVVQAALPGVPEIDARIMANWQRLDPAAVESMLGFLSPQGKLKQGLQTEFGPAIADGVEQKLIDSVAFGYNPRKTATAIVQQLGIGLVSALRTTRTAQLMAYRESTRAAYMANPEIVKGWRWHAARDSRTCMGCIAMDGTLHKPDERLNDHWNGRCTMIPVTLDYSDLGLKVPPRVPTDQWLASQPEDKQRQYLGKRYDAWKSGETRFSESAADWFKRQPEAAQKEQMGKGRYEAWKAGQFDLKDMSMLVPDTIWGNMRVATPLKLLVEEWVAA
jgi:hypothetical protein